MPLPLKPLLLALGLSLGLAACGAEPKWAPDADVARAVYRADEPPSITLYTAIRNLGGEGGHSAILINGSQRVMFDPAGTWWHATVPERNDVLYGMTPTMLDFYIDYHARATYHVVEQKIYVTPEVAERAIALAQANGAAPKAFCARSTSGILSQLPGFDPIGRTFFPDKLMDQFAKLPGVRTVKYYDDDGDDNQGLLVLQGADAAPPSFTRRR